MTFKHGTIMSQLGIETGQCNRPSMGFWGKSGKSLRSVQRKCGFYLGGFGTRLRELFARSQMLKVEFGQNLPAHGGWTL